MSRASAVALHRCTFLSLDPDATRLPHGDNAIEVIPWLCSLSCIKILLPCPSQIWKDPSEFETMCVPSVENDRDEQETVLLIDKICSPEFEFQIQMIESSDPDTIRVPSGENATERTAPL